MSVNEVLKAVQSLTPEDREQVRALFDTLPSASSSPEDEAQARLHAAGLLGETRLPATTGRARHTPVEIKGKPLSQTVIEGRR